MAPVVKPWPRQAEEKAEIGKTGSREKRVVAVMERVLTGKSGARAGRFRVCEKCEVVSRFVSGDLPKYLVLYCLKNN